MNWLKYNKALRNIFTILLIFIVYAAAIIWMGFLKDFQIEKELVTNIGVLSVIALVGVRSVRFDFTQRAFVDENTKNPDLQKVNKGIFDTNEQITNDKLGQKWVDLENEEKQKLADFKLTKKIILKKRKKVRKYNIKKKLPLRLKLFSRFKTCDDYVKFLEQKIVALEKNPKRDKKYKPIKYDNLVSVGDTVFKKELSDQEHIDYDPRKDAWWSYFFSILKFVTIGGSAIPFRNDNLDWDILIAFWIALTVSMVITVVRRYISIRRKTAINYLKSRKRKLNMMRKCKEFIDEEETKERIKKNQEDTDKDIILKTDSDVIFKMDGNAYMVHRKSFINPMESRGEYGYGKTYKEAYVDMQKNHQQEVEFKKILQDLEIHFKTDDKLYELKVSSNMFNKQFILTRLNDLYDVKYITHIQTSYTFVYEIKLKKEKVDVKV